MVAGRGARHGLAPTAGPDCAPGDERTGRRGPDVAPALLQVRDVSLAFGGVVALDRVGFEVAPGAICGLIGPNGAGKTSMVNCITRAYRPDSGDIVFDGTSLLRTGAHDMVRRGIARTFQNLELFASMSVLDNVLVGDHVRIDRALLSAGVRAPRVRRSEAAARDRALEALRTVGIERLAGQPVAAVPHSAQKLTEMARALVSRPRLLLLDEPAGGLGRQEVDGLTELIRRVRDEFALTILLIEHHMNLVMSLCDRVVVLDFGRAIATGTPREIHADPAVIDAYLGIDDEGDADARAH
jgi:branched-chain amino acid transport system ATP-binding protein